MPSSYSTRLRFELIGVGEFGVSGNWGTTTNVNLGTLIEEAIAGIAPVPVTDGAATVLSAIDGGTDQSRQMILNLTGALTAQREVRCPAVQKLYFVRNATSGGHGVLFKTASGTGVVVPNGKIRAVYCDGTNVNDLITDLPATTQLNGVEIATISGTQTLTNKTLTSPRVDTAILDTNGNEAIRVAATASAVNEIQVVNAATSGTPTILATGNDTNVGINLVSKGTGQIFANSLPVATTTGTQTLTNKTIDTTNTINARDDIFQILDNADGNKRARFELSGVQSGATRVITVPNFDYTLGTVLANTVGTSQIIDGNVTLAKMASNSVGTNQIVNANVTLAKMAANSVGTSQIIDANVTQGKMAANSVGTSQLIDGNVTQGKLAANSVGVSQIIDGNITTAKIGDAQITTAKIGNNQVTTSIIGPGQVLAGNLADLNVTTAKIADLNVTAAKIADGNVTESKLANASVTPAKLSQPFVGMGVRDFVGVGNVEFTGIPIWVKRITISFVNVLTTGLICVRVGNLSVIGGYMANGYYWSCNMNGGNSLGSFGGSNKPQFVIYNGNNYAPGGHMILTNLDNNSWAGSYSGGTVQNLVVQGGGWCSGLGGGGSIERINIYSSDFTNFTGGLVNVFYE